MMKLCIGFLSFILVVVVVAANHPTAHNAVRFHAKKTQTSFVETEIKNLLEKNSGRLTTYQYKNCGDPNVEIGNIASLVFGPDPIVFPGPLNVQFSGTVKSTINAPVAASLLLQIKVGNTYVKIPCVSQVGSCTYEDVCVLLAQIPQCPASFISAGVPCQCPFAQGNYNLPQTSFQVDVPVFPPGDYHAVANITTSTNLVACVELFVSFA